MPSPRLLQVRKPPAIAALPSFYLQLAAYRHEDGARESAARLQALGFEVEVQKDNEYHRLLVGPLESRDAVSRTSDRLDQALQSSTNMRRTIPGPWMTVQPSQNSTSNPRRFRTACLTSLRQEPAREKGWRGIATTCM